MFSFCYFYFFFVQKNFTFFFASLYKGVVGFLPLPSCKTLTFFKSLSIQ